MIHLQMIRLSRNTTVIIHWFLDNLIPPVLRDSKWFMYPFLYAAFGDKTKHYLSFKEQAPYLSEREFSRFYQELASTFIDRKTDLNETCIEEILENLQGKNILEVGCGKGFLSRIIAKQDTHHITGVDIHPPKESKAHKNLQFVSGTIENLPFPDKSFDTVICTHTLEHVQNLAKSIQELRRVTKKRLIVVVPKQRPYRYTFDLHLHFFPYIYTLEQIMGGRKDKTICQVVGHDIYYQEDIK